jgi:hypothetical protein
MFGLRQVAKGVPAFRCALDFLGAFAQDKGVLCRQI